MAEFFGPRQEQFRREDDNPTLENGFNNMGKPVPFFRKTAGLAHCISMGVTNKVEATGIVDRMSKALERDQPYEAIEAGMAHLGLIGTYRLMAVLLTAEPLEGEDPSEPERSFANPQTWRIS